MTIALHFMTNSPISNVQVYFRLNSKQQKYVLTNGNFMQNIFEQNTRASTLSLHTSSICVHVRVRGDDRNQFSIEILISTEGFEYTLNQSVKHC